MEMPEVSLGQGEQPEFDMKYVQSSSNVLDEENLPDTSPVNVCLICFSPINQQTPVDQNASGILLILSKILKLSPSIYVAADTDVLEGPLYCGNCGYTFSEGVELLRELESIEAKLTAVRNGIKGLILSTYNSQALSQDVSPHTFALSQIRRTLVQCWSDCRVHLQVTKLKCEEAAKEEPATSYGQRRHPGRMKTKLHLRKEPKKFQSVRRHTERIAGSIKSLNEPVYQQETLNTVMSNTVEVKSEPNEASVPVRVSQEDVSFQEIKSATPENVQSEAKVNAENEKSDDFDEDYQQPDDDDEAHNDSSEETESDDDNVSTTIKATSHSIPGVVRVPKSQDCGQKFPFSCQVCGKGYQQNHFLQQHMESHSENWTYICFVCHKKFPCSRHLKLHEVNAHKLPTTNSRKIELSIYGPKRNPLDSFTCEYCEQEYIKENYRTDSGSIKVTCDIEGCGKEFFVFRHFRRHHDMTCPQKSPNQFACETCGKIYASKKTLAEHKVISHTKEYEYVCEVCGQGYVSQGALTRHKLVHTDEKKFECEICHWKFKRKMQLTYHMRNHTKDSLLVCGSCGKTANNPQSLRNHELTHSQEKLFPCHLCNKMFKTLNYVYNHIWATHKKSRQQRTRIKGNNLESDENPPDMMLDQEKQVLEEQ